MCIKTRVKDVNDTNDGNKNIGFFRLVFPLAMGEMKCFSNVNSIKSVKM